MTLADFQHRFIANMLNSNSTDMDSLSAQIFASEGLSAIQHIQIYQRGIQGSLLDALQEIYPVCVRLVGTAFFQTLAKTYIQQTPSISPDLADYGQNFGDFIADFPAAARLVYLPDVAKLEWTWHRAFNAVDAPILDTEALQAQLADWQHLILELAPACTLFHSDYPVQRIWSVNQTDYQGDGRVDLEEGEVHLIIFRQADYQMVVQPLVQSEWHFLNGIKQGQRFAQLCERYPDVEIASCLATWVQAGWICGFYIQANPA